MQKKIEGGKDISLSTTRKKKTHWKKREKNQRERKQEEESTLPTLKSRKQWLGNIS